MSKKLRILNTTHKISPPRGFALDLEGKYIAAGREITIELGVIPVTLEDWQKKGWCAFQDADDKTPLSSPAETVVTKGTDIKEAAPDDMLEEEEFDLDGAKEATLTQSTAPIMGDMRQTAKVSLGMTEGTTTADSLSPIPGDRPRSVDDAEKFTIRAPRSEGPGAVMK